MKTQNSSAFRGLLFLVIGISFYAVRCSENTSNNDGTADRDGAMQGAGSAAMEARTDTVGGAMSDADATPATRERRAAVEDLRAIRAQMMAELEQVRERLNTGSRPKIEEDADKARAGELAEGLDRADRAIALAEAATDENWTNAQDTTRRAANEVRVWWNSHRNATTARAN